MNFNPPSHLSRLSLVPLLFVSFVSFVVEKSGQPQWLVRKRLPRIAQLTAKR